MIRTVVFVLFCLITLQGLAQSTAQGKIQNIHTQIKTDNNQKMIFLSLNYSSCSIEVLINDMPVYSNLHGKVKSTSSFTLPINQYVLQSGIQDLKIKVYPVSNDNDVLQAAISDLAKVSVKVIYGQKGQKISSYQTLVDYTMEQSLSKDTPYYQSNKDFQVKDLPYSLVSWSNSVDLEKQNRDELQKEVLAYFQEYIQDLKDNNLESICNKLYEREYEKSIANYVTTQQESNEILESILNQVNTQQDYLPIDDYKIVFYGNSKVVTLIREDNYFRGESALIGETLEEYNFYPILLHRPYLDGPLQIIR